MIMVPLILKRTLLSVYYELYYRVNLGTSLQVLLKITTTCLKILSKTETAMGDTSDDCLYGLYKSDKEEPVIVAFVFLKFIDFRDKKM